MRNMRPIALVIELSDEIPITTNILPAIINKTPIIKPMLEPMIFTDSYFYKP